MRNTLSDGDRRAGRSVQCFVPIGDVHCAFQNDEMLILALVDMHCRAVSGIRDQFKHRVSLVRRFAGGTNFEPFSRCYLQPLTIALTAVG